MQEFIKAVKALSDETRLRILKVLLERECCVCEVMQALDISQSRASRNLGILQNAGFLREKRDGLWIVYSVDWQTVNQHAASLVKLRSELDAGSAELAIFKQPVDDAKDQRADINERLAKVTSLKPGNAQIKSINYTGASISVSGTSPDMALVLNYVSALRDSGMFSKVVIRDLTEVQFNEWNFILQLD